MTIGSILAYHTSYVAPELVISEPSALPSQYKTDEGDLGNV